MKLSTKGRYGVRLMLDLASKFGQGPVFLKDIAQRQDISEKYLWHLLAQLKNAGLVNSIRGAHGGYILSRPPSEISLKDIISVLEGSLCLVPCVDDKSFCGRTNACIANQVWSELTGKISGLFEEFTLEKMLDKQQEKSELILYAI